MNSDSLDIMNVIYKNSNIKIVVAVGRPNRNRDCDVAVRGYRDRASGFEIFRKNVFLDIEDQIEGVERSQS